MPVKAGGNRRGGGGFSSVGDKKTGREEFSALDSEKEASLRELTMKRMRSLKTSSVDQGARQLEAEAEVDMMRNQLEDAREARVKNTIKSVGDASNSGYAADRAFEGFGTVEAAQTSKPLVPLMPERGILSDGMVFVTNGNADEVEVRVVLTSTFMGFGADLDDTFSVMREMVPLEEITSIVQEGEVLELQTDVNGYNSGRVYLLRKCTDDMVGKMHQAHRKALARKNSKRKKFRRFCRWIYNSRYYQVFLSCVIIVNFCLVVYEAQVQPLPSSDPVCVKDPQGMRCKGIYENLQTFDILFTIYFCLDVFVNMIVNWFFPFIKNKWSVFDFVIVAISLVNALNITGPHPTPSPSAQSQSIRRLQPHPERTAAHAHQPEEGRDVAPSPGSRDLKTFCHRSRVPSF